MLFLGCEIIKIMRMLVFYCFVKNQLNTFNLGCALLEVKGDC
jgi:hypothetical protein